MPLYHGWSRPEGVFASQLEIRWHFEFVTYYRWDAEYVGKKYRWADFKVGDVFIEIKPAEEDKLWQAIGRCPLKQELLIIYGEPKREEWWHIKAGEENAYRLGHPKESTHRPPFRIESPREFISRSLKEVKARYENSSIHSTH